MPPTTFDEPSIDDRGRWTPLFGAAGLIVSLFLRTEKHLIQRCTPCNAIALQYVRNPGKWGHAYPPDVIDLAAVEILGGPATSDRWGHPVFGLYTVDRITLYGKGLHRVYCEFIIMQCIHALGDGYRPYADLESTLFCNIDPDSADLNYFKKLRIAMRTIIAVYEAHAARGTSIVPEEYRSIWTDEEGHVRDLSPPRVYDVDDIHMWSCACMASIGHTLPPRPHVDVWDGLNMYSSHLTWWFEQVGYSPSTDWNRCGNLIFAASEAAIKGGLISVPISVRVRRDSGFDTIDAINAAISSTVQEYSEASTAGQQELHGEFHVTSEYEPAGEFIAGVIVTVLGKLVVSIFCAFATGGGPWLVIWLTTALSSQWYPRDFGGLRGGRTCLGTGRHVHDKEKCRLKFLDTACVTSAGSEHSRVLGVILAAVGWGIGRASYSFIPQTSVLLTITEWDSTVGFAVGNASLISVCFIGLLTISYRPPKNQEQKYFLYRIGLEWGIAIVAVAVLSS
jgi:hypothetical protein